MAVWSLILIIGLLQAVSASSPKTIKCAHIPRHYDMCSSSAPTDYIKLALKNTRVSCQSNRCNFPHWVIHGLWPSYSKGHGQCFCDRSSYIDRSSLKHIIRRLHKDWPSTTKKSDISFWGHEWCRHGTCAVAANLHGVNDKQSFFTKAISLYEKSNITQLLSAAKIYPSKKSPYKIDKFLSVFKMKPILKCKTGGRYQDLNMLYEIQLCFNKQFERMDCDASWHESDGRTCNKDFYYI